MAIIGTMFGVLGFAVGINAFFIPFVKGAFHISIVMSYLVMTATFTSYVVFGYPSAVILKKFGYKGGMVIAFLIMALGFYLIALSAKIVSFPLLLLALFVGGMGQALLTGPISTYVSILGPEESAARRIALMGICNKTFYAAASLILAAFMDLTNIRIDDTIFPFYILSGVLAVMGLLYYFAPLPEIKANGEEDDSKNQEASLYANSKTSIFQFPHLLLGILAIFCDAGLEYTALGTINDYAATLSFSTPQNYVWFVSAGMVIGYLFGVIFIPKFVSQATALLLSTVSGVVATLAVVLFPENISIYLVALLGLSNALMWPAIWPLAIADLGKFTKTGTSLLVTGIIGGAFFPLLFGYIAQAGSYRVAYLVCLPAYIFIMYYALSGSKIRTKKKEMPGVVY